MFISGSFRQAQVSFSTRIPNAVPLGDAYSMSIDISLYNTGNSVMHFRDMVLKSAKSFKDSNPKMNNEDGENSSALPSVMEESDGDQKLENRFTEDKELQNENYKDPTKPTKSELGKQKSILFLNVLF